MITIGKNQSKVITVPLYSSSRRRAVTAKNDIVSKESSHSVRTLSRRLEVVLAGENARIDVYGLLMAKGEQQTAFEVYITHAAQKTKSNVNVRAVLRGRSTFAFRGNVKIEKGAKGADAYLRSDALLFDEAKMGDDTPALEILEPDVKAGHAATVGKVDENMLFYLMSRGLSKAQAEKLLIDGFIKPIQNILRAQREVTLKTTNNLSGKFSLRSNSNNGGD